MALEHLLPLIFSLQSDIKSGAPTFSSKYPLILDGVFRLAAEFLSISLLLQNCSRRQLMGMTLMG
jgi:hypothetical protein